MKTLRMTDRWLTHVSVVRGREEFADAIARGLRLRVSVRSKKWSVITRRAGKQVRVPLGDFPTLGLSAARARANDVLNAASVGDLERTIVRSSAGKTPPLETLCSDYVGKMTAKNQRSTGEYERALIRSDESFCRFMERRLGRSALVGDVRASHVAAWLRQIYDRAPSHARHCRAYLHAVFEWAMKAEFDYTAADGRSAYGVGVNPVSATPGGAKSSARQRVLSADELKALWALAADVAHPATAAALRMMIAMGGLRVSEILQSERSWYEKGWLTLPETKNGRENISSRLQPMRRRGVLIRNCSPVQSIL